LVPSPKSYEVTIKFGIGENNLLVSLGWLSKCILTRDNSSMLGKILFVILQAFIAITYLKFKVKVTN